MEADSSADIEVGVDDVEASCTDIMREIFAKERDAKND
jgi:hypothetical protein